MKKQIDLEFEQYVAYDIFPSLLYSVHFDKRLTSPPPPPPNSEWNDSTEIELIESQIIEYHERRKAELDKDTTKLVIAIVDSTYQIGERAKKELVDYYKENSIKLHTNNSDKPYKINISDLRHDRKFKLKYRSKLPTTSKVWKTDYDFHLSGITGFYRIQFDQTKNYGVLKSGFGCESFVGSADWYLLEK